MSTAQPIGGLWILNRGRYTGSLYNLWSHHYELLSRNNKLALMIHIPYSAYLVKTVNCCQAIQAPLNYFYAGTAIKPIFLSYGVKFGEICQNMHSES